MIPTIGDQFALRGGEFVEILSSIEGCTMAVMAAPVTALPEPSLVKTQRGPVEPLAIVAAELWDGKWQWMRLADDTKEYIGDMLMAEVFERGVWYGLKVSSKDSGDKLRNEVHQ